METPITVLRAGKPEHTPEAELATVQADQNIVVLRLEDGETLELDREELLATLEAA